MLQFKNRFLRNSSIADQKRGDSMYICILLPGSSAMLRVYLPEILAVSTCTAIPAKGTKGLCSPNMDPSKLRIIREFLLDQKCLGYLP